MTPAEREEALQRREANAALLMAKLEKDRQALESEISASAAASKAASAITKALQSDAAKKAKNLEAECVQWEAKLSRLKSDVAKATPVVPVLSRSEEEITKDKAEIAAAKAQFAIDRSALDAERAAFEKDSSAIQAKNKTETQALAELRARLVSIRSEIEGNVKLIVSDPSSSQEFAELTGSFAGAFLAFGVLGCFGCAIGLLIVTGPVTAVTLKNLNALPQRTVQTSDRRKL